MVRNAKIQSSAPPSFTSSSNSGSDPAGRDDNGGCQQWPIIGTKDEIPLWLRDNDFIITGHPMPTHSYHRSFRLWCCLHMETMNIWTHVIGCIEFMVAGTVLCCSTSLGAGDVLALGVSIMAAAVCFGLSTIFHTLRSHSYDVHHFWGKMDILGICSLALGGGSSITYYAFRCQPVVQRVYCSLNVASAVLAAVTLFDTGGGGSRMRTLRGGVFGLLAISAMLPLFHRTWVVGWDQASVELGLRWYLGEGLALLVGVTLFVGRLPERFWPGRFDIWGHSHQLFHIFAVLGAVLHVAGLSVASAYQRDHPNCPAIHS